MRINFSSRRGISIFGVKKIPSGCFTFMFVVFLLFLYLLSALVALDFCINLAKLHNI